MLRPNKPCTTPFPLLFPLIPPEGVIKGGGKDTPAPRRWALSLILLCLVCISGCRQDMHDQPRYEPLEASSFFSDGKSARTPIEGTVARGQLNADTHLITGKINGELATEMPFPLTQTLLKRGQERYNIYCSPCHDRVGTGQGMIVRRGFRQPPSFHADRLRQAPIGHYVDVIGHGFGVMMDYAAQVNPHDRWAIAAFIRALQLSQHASLNDVPASTRTHLSMRAHLQD